MGKLLTKALSQKPNFLRAGLVVLIIVIPLFPKFPIFNLPATYVAIRVEDFLIAATGIVLLPYLWVRRKELLSDNLNFGIAVFLLVGLISLISANFLVQVFKLHLGFLHWLRRIEYFLPFFVVVFSITKLREIFSLLYLLLIVGILVVAYGVGQIYFGFPVISTTNEEFSKGLLLPLEGPAVRVNSTFAGQFDLAVFLAITLTIGLAFIFAKIPNFPQAARIKIPVAIIGVLLYWLLLQTGSRIGFLAFLAGLVTVGLLWGRRWLILGVLVLAFLGLVFGSPLSERFLITIKQQVPIFKQISHNLPRLLNVQAQVQQLVSTKAATPAATPVITAETEPPAPGEPTNLAERIIFRSSGIRFDVEWPRAARAFLKNPLLGTGYSSLGLATDNDYLRALGETGILGFLAFLAIFAEIIKRVVKFFKGKTDVYSKIIVSAITGSIVVMGVSGFFIDVFEASKVAILFWILVGFLVVTIKLSYISRST